MAALDRGEAVRRAKTSEPDRTTMGITCHLKNEAQEDIQVVGDAEGLFSSLVLRGAFKKCQVLMYLDPCRATDARGAGGTPARPARFLLVGGRI
jgi:hypothetical protein